MALPTGRGGSHLAARHAINEIIDANNLNIHISARGVNEMVATDGDQVAVAAIDHHIQIAGWRVSAPWQRIFPKLSFDVVSQLETVYYDALYLAQQQYATSPQDEAQTLGFVLRHVFQIEPAVIKSSPDLLKMLCERHYRKLSIPPLLDKYLIAALRQNPDFKDWPLEIIVPNPAAFWEFLNERWPIYVRQSKGGTMMIHDKPPTLKYPGPELLPFGHDAVHVHIDNLFEDGLLTPVEWDWSQAIDEKWIRVGLLGNKVENTDLRFEELGKSLLKDCPDKNAAPQDWLTFAYRYAQARMLWTQISAAKRTQFQKQFPELCGFANQQFYAWLTANYGGISNYPAITPLMVHHIPGCISHRIRAINANAPPLFSWTDWPLTNG